MNLDLYVKLEDVREVIVLEEERYQYQHNANGISTGSHGTLAKALAYKEMFETYFRRKSTGYKTILTLPAKRAKRLRQHQTNIEKPLPLIEPWNSLFSTWKTFPELMIHPTMCRTTICATLRNL